MLLDSAQCGVAHVVAALVGPIEQRQRPAQCAALRVERQVDQHVVVEVDQDVQVGVAVVRVFHQHGGAVDGDAFVSFTTISTCEFTRSSATRTFPPWGVNLIALFSRFHTTCWRGAGSALTGPTGGSSTAVSFAPLISHVGLTVSSAALTTPATSTRCTSRRIFPEMMRDRSRRSSVICVRALC